MTVLHTAVGVGVWRGARSAGRLATVLMVLGVVPSSLFAYSGFAALVDDHDVVHSDWSITPLGASITPLGDGPIGDLLNLPILLFWPLTLIVLAVTVVVLTHTRPAREYFAAMT